MNIDKNVEANRAITRYDDGYLIDYNLTLKVRGDAPLTDEWLDELDDDWDTMVECILCIADDDDEDEDDDYTNLYDYKWQVASTTIPDIVIVIMVIVIIGLTALAMGVKLEFGKIW